MIVIKTLFKTWVINASQKYFSSSDSKFWKYPVQIYKYKQFMHNLQYVQICSFNIYIFKFYKDPVQIIGP